MNHHLLLIIHLMSATVWVGGHLILVASYLPRAIKEKNQNYILNYEKKYEPIGMLVFDITCIVRDFNGI